METVKELGKYAGGIYYANGGGVSRVRSSLDFVGYDAVICALVDGLVEASGLDDTE